MALVQTPILSAMWNDIVQRIQMAANLQIRIEARFAPEPRLLTSTGASGAPARSDDCQDAFSRAQRIHQSRSRQYRPQLHLPDVMATAIDRHPARRKPCRAHGESAMSDAYRTTNLMDQIRSPF